MMARNVNRPVLDALAPLFRAVGFIVSSIFSVLYEPFYRYRRLRRQKELEQDIRDQLSFLFAEHAGRVMPGQGGSNLSGLNVSTVTVLVTGILLRFIRWRDEFQVHVASERAPNEWYELSRLLTAIENPEPHEERPPYWMPDVERWLGKNLSSIKRAFDEPLYTLVRERMAQLDRYDKAANRQWEYELNRNLYP